MRRLSIGCVVLCLLPLVATAAGGGEPGAPPLEGVEGITAPELGGHLRFIASDLLEGRNTASRGERLAAEYLAAQLRQYGAEPAGDRRGRSTSFFQGFPLEVTTPDIENTRLDLVVEVGGARQTLSLAPAVDFHCYARGLATMEIEAPVVFAGRGIVSEEHQIDDYRDLEVEGRIVVVFDGHPEGVPLDKRGRFRPAGFRAKRMAAQERGALAILVVHAPESEAAPFSKTMRWARRTFSRSSSSLGGGKPTFPMLYLEDSARDFLLRTGALTDLPETGPARGLTARFRFAATREIETARNVVAIFPGSDPERAGEVIVYSAHYDHIGVNDQGEVFNGADDNGSGTCALLEVAEAFAEGARPPRSVAFLWVSGEEKGLLGSRWFVEHSPLGEKYEIVADINLDMVGRNEAAKVSATPSPKHKDYSTLNVSLGRAAEAEGYELLYNADQYYGRTDSYNFAKQRIPSMFLFTGEHKDYHRPSDTFEKIDLEKAAAIARIAYRTGWRAASSESRPEYIEAAEEMPQVAGEEAGEQRTRVFF